MRIGVDEEAGKLPDNRGIRQARLPGSRDDVLFSGRVIDAKSILELSLAIEGGDLKVGNFELVEFKKCADVHVVR